MTDTTLGLTVSRDGTRTPRVDLPFRYGRTDNLRPARGILRGVVLGAGIWVIVACAVAMWRMFA